MSTQDLPEYIPSLFDGPPPAAAAQAAIEEPGKEDKESVKVAKEFVRWCFSFGSDFRNSPDITNLRFWVQRAKLKLKAEDESRVLAEARTLFSKRLESMMKKAADPILTLPAADIPAPVEIS
jgi:hypothetical protein